MPASRQPCAIPAFITVSWDELSVHNTELTGLIQAVLDRGAQFQFRVRGSSMSPLIKDGDLLIINPLSRCNPSMGRVVACLHPKSGKLIVHCDVGVRADSLLIKDYSSYDQADGWIPLNQTQGCVSHVEREGNPVKLGLGPERYLIAWFSRHGLWLGLIRGLNRILTKWP